MPPDGETRKQRGGHVPPLFLDLCDFVPVFALRLIQMQVERDVERNAYRGGDGRRGRFWSGWRSAECSCNRQCQAFSAKKTEPLPKRKTGSVFKKMSRSSAAVKSQTAPCSACSGAENRESVPCCPQRPYPRFRCRYSRRSRYRSGRRRTCHNPRRRGLGASGS